MKTKLILAVAVGIILVCCNKENTNLISSTSLIGEWNWISSTEGMAAITYTPQTTGNIRRITFDSDSIFRLYRNDTLKIESKYHLSILPASNGLESTKWVKFDFTSIRQSYTIQSNGILTLSDECMDCSWHQYRRIK